MITFAELMTEIQKLGNVHQDKLVSISEQMPDMLKGLEKKYEIRRRVNGSAKWI